MDLLIRDYLATHSFQNLEDEHGINARPDKFLNKFSLNYDQIYSKSGALIAEQCRGLIIRPHINLTIENWKNTIIGEFDVIARPMNRFYNYGDSSASDINWNDPNLRVYEKLDGTCIILYWDKKKLLWYAATRSVPEADIPIFAGHVAIGNTTFSGLFWTILEKTYNDCNDAYDYVHECDWLDSLDKELTYVFELVSPYNRVVVSYKTPEIYLLAVRNTSTGKEVHIESIEMCKFPGIRRPRTFPTKDINLLSMFVDSASPSELEGAVVCDSSFRRVKVKNKSYVLAHKSKDAITSSERNVLEYVILEKIDDVIPFLPKEIGELLINMQYKFANYCKQIDNRVFMFHEIAGNSRKLFAEQVLLSGDLSAPYFSMWENRVKTSKEWFKVTCENKKLSSNSLDVILAKMSLAT